MPGAETKVIIADDHPLFRVALRLILRDLSAGTVVIEADSFDSLRSAIDANPTTELVLLDLMMPGVDGLSSLQFLHSKFPSLRVAVISALSQRSWVRSAQALGAVAFVHKSARPEHLRETLRSLLVGSSWWPQSLSDVMAEGDTMEQKLERLSRQELQILLYLKGGRLNKQIAAELHISESTVKTHVSSILHKLGLNSRTQAALVAQQLLAAEQAV